MSNSNTTFESLMLFIVKFIFPHPVYLEGIRDKFIYEGHRVKIKDTGATIKGTKVKNPYSCNVKLRLARTLVL